MLYNVDLSVARAQMRKATRDMVMLGGRSRSQRDLSRCRFLFHSYCKSEIDCPTHSLKSQRNEQDHMRKRPQLARKDWSLENTRQIPWTRLQPFLQKHVKATDSYIRETFHKVCVTSFVSISTDI